VKTRRISICLAALMAVCACKGKGSSSEEEFRKFPQAQAPAMCDTREAVVDYLLGVWWKGFLVSGYKTDSTHLAGVPNTEVEQALSNYITLLSSADLQKARKSIAQFFSLIEKTHAADSTSHFYPLLTEMVSRYLYDPNSPFRDEDIYEPFARGLSESSMVPEDLRPAFSVEARYCAMNRRGSVAPDFKVKTITGRVFRMYDVKAEYTMLFFSNPGCHACKGIIDEVMGRPYTDGWLESGRLAVMNVYIDEDLKAWREYEHNYPRSWHTGYDPEMIIRGDRLYNVRAIPSLYLLDSEKRVIMKDAPTEKVLAFFDNLYNETVSGSPRGDNE